MTERRSISPETVKQKGKRRCPLKKSGGWGSSFQLALLIAMVMPTISSDTSMPRNIRSAQKNQYAPA